MIEDPARWRDAPAELPAELRYLVTEAEEPPPLPPEIRARVREQVSSAVVPPASSVRWALPAVAALTGLAALVVLAQWHGEPEPDSPRLVQEQAPELVPGPAPVVREQTEEPAPPTQPAPEQRPGQGRATPPPVLLATDGPTATLLVAVSGGPAEVFVDGYPVGPAPVQAMVSPGTRRVMARFADLSVTNRVVRVEAGDELRIVIGRQSDAVAEAGDPRSSTRPTLFEADLRAVVQANRRQAQRCYERHRDPDGPTIRLSLEMEIAPDGRVAIVRILGPGSPAFHACLKQMALAWRFPAGPSVTRTLVPFVFQPGNDAAAAASSTGRGRLMINTQPWSRVYLDGRAIGNTPIAGYELPAGRHELRFEAEGYTPERMVVVIRAGETTRIVRRLAGD